MMMRIIIALVVMGNFAFHPVRAGEPKKNVNVNGSREEGTGTTKEPVLLFPAVKGKKWGFIDKAGKAVIDFQFDYAWDFQEGLANVQVGDLRGYVDQSGTLVIKPQYFLSCGFKEGRAAVLVGAKKWGSARNGGKWGVIDRTGKLVIKATFLFVSNYSEGFSRQQFSSSTWVFMTLKGGRKFGWMEAIQDFSEGLAAVTGKRKPWSFIDKNGKKPFELDFADAGSFSEGLARVKPLGKALDKRGRKREPTKWGFVDKTGKYVVEQKYDQAGDFSEGVAAVAVGEKWGCIDKTGATVIEPAYDFIGPFKKGVARVVSGGKHGFIDRSGKVIVEPVYEYACAFNKGLARVEAEGKVGYVDVSGSLVWQLAD